MADGLLTEEEKGFERYYKWSRLWLNVKPSLKRVILGMFIVFDVMAVGWFLYRYVDYGIFNFFGDRAMIGSIADGAGALHLISESRSADPLQVGGEQVFFLSDQRVDFFGEMTNPNADWYATFTYKFVYSGGETEEQDGFILPGEEEKPLTELAFSYQTRPSGADLVISDVEWIRVNRHLIPDYEAWEEERLRFIYEDIQFERTVAEEGESFTNTFGRSSFVVHNNTAFGYFNPDFTVVLLRSGNVVAVTSASVANLEPSERREVVVNWFGDLPLANETRIIPNIDIFDPDVFLPVDGQPLFDVRQYIRAR